MCYFLNCKLGPDLSKNSQTHIIGLVRQLHRIYGLGARRILATELAVAVSSFFSL